MFLYKLVLGATVKGRFTEQHDVFLGIGSDIKSLVPDLKAFWNQGVSNLHIDSYEKVLFVDDYAITIVPKQVSSSHLKLFFLNLGGYAPDQKLELHEHQLIVAKDIVQAKTIAKQSKFFKEMTFKGATSHIDNKYGVDIDDIYPVEDMLPSSQKAKYSILITPIKNSEVKENEVRIGYFKLSDFK